MRRLPLRLSFIALLAALLAGCLSIEAALPGSAPSSLSSVRPGNNETVRLQAGRYEGVLRIDANAATVVGAGVGRTVIVGDVVISGNTNTVRGVTIRGTVTISGNNNDLAASDLTGAAVRASGNNNRY